MSQRGSREYIEDLAKKIVDEMPDLTEEECAILSVGGDTIRIIPTGDIPLVLYDKILELVRKIAEGKTFNTEKINVLDRPIYEEEARKGIVISIFLKE